MHLTISDKRDQADRNHRDSSSSTPVGTGQPVLYVLLFTPATDSVLFARTYVALIFFTTFFFFLSTMTATRNHRRRVRLRAIDWVCILHVPYILYGFTRRTFFYATSARCLFIVHKKKSTYIIQSYIRFQCVRIQSSTCISDSLPLTLF